MGELLILSIIVLLLSFGGIPEPACTIMRIVAGLGLAACPFVGIKEHQDDKKRKETEQQNLRIYGTTSEKKVAEYKANPRYRNQKRGRGPRNGNLDPTSCEVCGSRVYGSTIDPFFNSTSHLCDRCKQRYEEALKTDQIPYIAGYTDDKVYGGYHKRQVWVKQQIAALDLRDGVINEATARAEIAAAVEEGRQWARQQAAMREREKRDRQNGERQLERMSHLNEDVQRLMH